MHHVYGTTGMHVNRRTCKDQLTTTKFDPLFRGIVIKLSSRVYESFGIVKRTQLSMFLWLQN